MSNLNIPRTRNQFVDLAYCYITGNSKNALEKLMKYLPDKVIQKYTVYGVMFKGMSRHEQCCDDTVFPDSIENHDYTGWSKCYKVAEKFATEKSSVWRPFGVVAIKIDYAFDIHAFLRDLHERKYDNDIYSMLKEFGHECEVISSITSDVQMSVILDVNKHRR